MSRLLMLLVSGSLCLALTAGFAQAHTSDCGKAVPPLPPGAYEENSFYKVTAENASCKVARRVAFAWLHTPRRHVDGYTCHELPTEPGDLLMRCTRGRAVVRGYNNGD